MGHNRDFLEEREAALGLRVSIRFHESDGGYRDLLGHLIGLNVVRRKDGSEVTFTPHEIAFFKVVPESPFTAS